jgi:hypothetical protein
MAGKQKRPGMAGAQWSTKILYHKGNGGQIKKWGQRKKSQNPQP